MTWALEEITQPISCNLCAQEFGDLQTYNAHVRLTHLPFPSPTVRESRHAQSARQPRRHRQRSRSGHGREPRIQQEGRQSRRRGAVKAASTNRQRNQTARRRGQRLDDSGTQAQGRRQGRAEESEQDHAQGHPQDASDDARPILDGVRHSADQSVESRSGQHAEADADIRREGETRGERTQTRPTLRVGISGLGQVSPAEGHSSGSENGTATYWARLDPLSPMQICDEVRFLQAGQNVQSRHQENHAEHRFS